MRPRSAYPAAHLRLAPDQSGGVHQVRIETTWPCLDPDHGRSLRAPVPGDEHGGYAPVGCRGHRHPKGERPARGPVVRWAL